MSEQPQSPTPPETPAAEQPVSPTRLRVQERMAANRKRDAKKQKPPEIDIAPVTKDRPRLRDLDAAIEAEMEAAMAGLSDKDLLGGEPDPRKAGERKPTGPNLLRSGRIIGVHGGD